MSIKVSASGVETDLLCLDENRNVSMNIPTWTFLMDPPSQDCWMWMWCQTYKVRYWLVVLFSMMRGQNIKLLIACSFNEIGLNHTLWWQFPAPDFSSTLPAQSPALPSPPQPFNQRLSHFRFRNIAAPPDPLCWQQLSEVLPPPPLSFLPCLIENTSSSIQVFLSVPPTSKFLSRAGSFCYFGSHHLNLKNQVNSLFRQFFSPDSWKLPLLHFLSPTFSAPPQFQLLPLSAQQLLPPALWNVRMYQLQCFFDLIFFYYFAIGNKLQDYLLVSSSPNQLSSPLATSFLPPT